MHWVKARQHGRDDRVARLVIGDDPALLVAHHALLLEPGNHAIDRFVEVLHLDGSLVAARGEERRFVHQVRKVGPGKARRPSRDDFQVDVLGGFHVLDVDAKNLLAAPHVGLVDEDLTVEPPRPQQRRIEDFWTVGRGHDDDALPGVKAVHLRQELVKGLLAFLVASHRRLDPDLPERVELIDEDDARGFVLGLVDRRVDVRAARHDHLVAVDLRAHRRDRAVSRACAEDVHAVAGAGVDGEQPLAPERVVRRRPVRVVVAHPALLPLTGGTAAPRPGRRGSAPRLPAVLVHRGPGQIHPDPEGPPFDSVMTSPPAPMEPALLYCDRLSP